MAVNQSIYPLNAQVRQLPIHLVGIGGSEYQGHVLRPDGYYWDQLLYSVKGQGCLKYDNSTITLSEGYFFFLPRNYPHEYYPVSDTWEVRWVVFDGPSCPDILRELALLRPLYVKPDDCNSLEKIYNKMFVAQKTDKIYGDYACSGFIYEYILEFYRQVSDKSMSGGSDKSELLMPVLNYIDDHFRRDFPMTVLAEKAGISPQHLCRIFKETMHMRPTEYLTYRRLTEAKELLRGTALPISEISQQVGFPDAGYFSTIFRRYEGVSPAEYRKNPDMI